MAFKDIFRDAGTGLSEYKNLELEKEQAQELTKLEALTTEELWKLHTSYSLHSPIGQNVLKTLKKRVPEAFNKNS